MPKRRSGELAAIDEVMPLVDQYNELEHAQRMIFLDMVDPLPEEVAPTKKSQKKTSKKSLKSSQSATKSEHASGMAAQLKKRRERGRGSTSSNYCYATVDDNGGEMTCGKPEDDSVHDLRYLSSHPFARDARPVPVSSPANGGMGIQSASEGPLP